MPADLRENAITFKAEDGVELPGLVFGSGSSGVLLAHTQTEVLCDWLPLARQLADDGHQVLVYEMRTLLLRENRNRYDLDVLGAAAELDSRGATSIVAGGGGTGATAIATAAGIGAVKVPSLVVAAQDDVIETGEADVEDVRLADHARSVADAASNAKLEIVPGKAHFAELIDDAALSEKVRAFVRETSPPPTFLERWLMVIAGGVLVLVLVVAGVVVLRRRVSR